MNHKKYYRRKNLHYIIHYAIYMLILSGLIVLYGCTGAPPRSAEEEIKLFEWVRTDEKDARDEQLGHIVFSENGVSLTSVQGDNRLDLTGECIIEESTITVITENFGTVVMGYELNSDRLTLSYFGKTATFVKK